MDKAERQRIKAKQGIATMPGTGAEVPWQEALRWVVQERAAVAAIEREAVLTARAAGWSWDRISVELGGVPSGEQLRRRYVEAAVLDDRGQVAALGGYRPLNR